MDYRTKIQWIEQCGIYVFIEGGWVGWVRENANSKKNCNEILTRLEGGEVKCNKQQCINGMSHAWQIFVFLSIVDIQDFDYKMAAP